MTTTEQPTMEHTGVETATDDAQLATRTLSGLDRCDSCGAQAYVRAMLGGSELLFCGHHAKQHEAKLKSIADFWHDETHKLES